MAPDLASLDYIARAVTPTHSPIRFNTRFFVADGGNVGGAIRETGELEDIDWHPAANALERDDLMGVTRFVLGEARRNWLDRPTPDPQRPIPTLSRWRGIRRIRAK